MVLSGEKYFEKRSPDGFYPERSILKRGVLMVLSGEKHFEKRSPDGFIRKKTGRNLAENVLEERRWLVRK